MIGLGLGLTIGGGSSTVGGFTAEYQAVIAKATALGYTLPSASTQTKQNQLLVDLKTSGAWAKLDVFYMFAQDGSKEFATINWKNPNANQITLVGALMTWNSSGYIGGLLSYLNTNYNPTTNATNFSQNNASVGIWKRTHDATAGKYMWGNSGASSIVKSVTDPDARLNQTGGLNATFPASNTGLLILNRTSSTAVSFSTNGTTTNTTSINPSVALVNANYSIFTYGTATASTYLGQISSFFLGASLVSETSAFYTAMNTYMSNF